MKKTMSIVLSFLLMLTTFSLFGCQKSDKFTIRLCEVTHSIFYAPMYVAINNGYFDEANIEIKLSNGGGADKVMTAITSKAADVGLMGPEATIYCHVEGQRNYPVIFGQLTQRDGSLLVSKKAEPNFKWTDLAGKNVIGGRPGGVPAMTLQWVIEDQGLQLDDLNFITNVDFNNIAAAFEGNDNIDYCTMFEPVASQFVQKGKGHIVASVGEAGGSIPFTAFSASKSYISENKEMLQKFLEAIMKGYHFIMDNKDDLAKIAAALKPSFFDSDNALIEASVKSYLDIQAWSPSPVMSKASFDRLQDVMQNAGHLDSRADYSVAVDNSIAESILS